MQPMLTMALRAANLAADIIAKAADRLDLVDVEAKGLNDYVTQVDIAAERAIIEFVRKTYPGHSIQAEESGATAGKGEDADWLWIIDPLDGTTNFIHGFPQYAISIAVQYRGVTEHAVVLDPLKREAFSASRGSGATMNGRRLRVSDRRTLEGALIGTGFPFRPDQMHAMDGYLNMFKAVATQTAGLRRAGAASLDLAYVAAGRLDGFFEFGLAPWDIAAGELIIREAGGLVSDFTGGHGYLTSGNIVAGNPKIFKGLLTTLAPHIPASLKR
ncbi:MAG: inositol-1-monophosphatase [Paraperlucidibaca sp.]|nr:inositol-1-monophosphatase [Paraperlucidibaca sp.]MBQ0842047.1 inositol-1-monophosphatase [Paraperlucidibaca sp.]